jgi:hypothetical protein
MKDKKKSISNEEIVKETYVFEADNRVEIDSARSLLKGSGHALSNLECQAGMGRYCRSTKRNEANKITRDVSMRVTRGEP